MRKHYPIEIVQLMYCKTNRKISQLSSAETLSQKLFKACIAHSTIRKENFNALMEK